MATPLETLIVTIETNLAKFQQETQQMAKAADKMASQIDSALGQVKTAFAGVTAGVALGKILQMADEYNVLQARIQQATKATGDYLGVSQQLQRISQQTGASLKDSTDVFQRLSLAAGNLGASNKQLLDLTATVQKLGVMGGASTTALNAGLLQFGQAMGAGTVRAEEFNSLIENIPLVAQKIAEGMGMTTAELRKLVLDGKVASKDVFESLLKQSQEISKEFEKMPVSLGRAMSNLKGSIEAAIGKLDSSLGVTSTLAAAIQKIADNGTLAVNALSGLAAGVAVFKIMTIDIAATTAAMSGLAASVAAATGGLTLVAAAVATGVAALIAFRDESITLGDKTVTIANLMQAAWLSVGEAARSTWEAIAGGASEAFDKLTKSVEKKFNDFAEFAKPVQEVLARIYSKMADGEARAGTMRYAFKRMWDGITEGARVTQRNLEAMFSGVQRSFETMFSDKHYELIRKMFGAIGGSIDSVVKRAEQLTQAQKEQARISEEAAALAQKQQEEAEEVRKKHEHDLEAVRKMVEEWDRQAEVVGKVTAQQKVRMDLEKAIAEIQRKQITAEEKAAAIAQLRVDAAARIYNLNQVAYEKEMELLDKISAKWAERAERAKNLTEEQKIQLEAEKDLEVINASRVGQLDKEVKIMQVRARAQAELVNKKAEEAEKETERFNKSMEDLKLQEQAAERRAKGLPEITEQMKIQAQLEKELLAGNTLNVERLQQKLAVLKHIDELDQLAKERKTYNEELKRLDDIVANYKDQQQAIVAKANGYERMLPLLKEERKIQEEIKRIQNSTTFTQDEKDTKTQELQQKLAAIRDGHAVTEQFNDQVKAQEKLIERITSGGKGYYNQIQDLKQAFQSGQITLHQYTEAWNKLRDGTRGASNAGKEFGNQIGKALEDGIINGKKMTDVIKDLGKELKNMAIRKLFIDPIKEKAGTLFDTVGRNLFGVGKTPGVGPGGGAAPILPPGVPALPLPLLPGGINAGGANPFGGFAGNLISPNGATATSSAPIYSYGPVTLNGGSVAMNNPRFPAMTFNNAGGGAGTFAGGGSGFLGGLGNLLGAPLRALGGSGGLGGLLGGLTSTGGLLGGLLGGLKNLLGGGSQIAGPINPASQSIFSGLGGLLNPLGLLGGIGKAAGATIGGDTIFRDIAPLLNPLGLFKGVGNALGGIFGGAREFGGSVWGGQSFLVGESGPELFTPYSSGYVTPNRQLDLAGVRQDPGGIPLYQQMQGFMPDWSMFNSQARAGEDGMQGWTIQTLLAKRDAYAAMSPAEQQLARTTGNGYFNSEDNWKLQRALHTIPLSVMGQLAELDSAQVQAGTQAILDNDFTDDFTKGWAASTQANATWAAIARALPPSLRNFSFATGNQAANTLNRWAHRGVKPGEGLLSYANALDYANDKLQPIGGWRTFGMGYQSGFAGGPGAPTAAAYFGDDPANNYAKTQWMGNDPQKMLTNDTAGWGSGFGYHVLKHQPTGTPFRNNSLLLQGPSVYHPNPIAKMLGLSGNGVQVAPPAGMGGGKTAEFKYDPKRLYNQASWVGNKFGMPGWTPLPQFMPGQTDVYGSKQNASGGFILDPQGNKLPWQSAFDYLGKLGYKPEVGWSLGDWFNTLKHGSINLGLGKPNLDWLRNIGTAGVPKALSGSSDIDWTSYHVPNPLLSKTASSGSGFLGSGTAKPLDAIGKALGGVFGGSNIIKDIAPLLNPLGFAKGVGSALGGLVPPQAKLPSAGGSSLMGVALQNAGLGGAAFPLQQSSDPFIAAKNYASDSFKQAQAWVVAHQKELGQLWNFWQDINPNQYVPTPMSMGAMFATSRPIQNQLQWLALDHPALAPYISPLLQLGSFGGNRQMGGPVEPGKFYQWNENGREYFASKSPGEVIPASKTSSAPQIQIHNYASGTHSAEASVDIDGVINIVFDRLNKEMRRSMPMVPAKSKRSMR